MATLDYLLYSFSFTSLSKDTLWSPTYVLATQIGNSLELSTVLVSFLIGFGFNAYVVCGWVDKATSAMDRKLEKCPMLAKAEIQAEADTSHLRYLLHIDHDTGKYYVVHT